VHRKQKTYWLIVCGVLAFLVFAVGRSIRIAIHSTGPQIAIDRMEHNWGKVTPGRQLETRFKVKNIGSQLLEIGELKASCGCTKPTISLARLKSGEEAAMTVKVNVPKETGPRIYYIIINSNDKITPKLEVSIFVNAWSGVVSVPESLHVSIRKDSTGFKGNLQLYAPDKRPFMIKNTVSDLQGLSVTSERGDVARPVHNIEVNYKITDDQGVFRGGIMIATDVEGSETVSVPVLINIKGNVVLIPNKIQVERSDLGKAISRTVVIRTNKDEVLGEISSVSATGAWTLLKSKVRKINSYASDVDVELCHDINSGAKGGNLIIDRIVNKRMRLVVPLSVRGWEAPLPTPENTIQ